MWNRRTIKLDKKVRVKARPGNNIFVANRGDVSFEYPNTWIVKPSERSICFYDAEPPDDQCVLELSIIHLNFRIDWSGLPLARMLCDVLPPEETVPALGANVREIRKGDLQIVWHEFDFMEKVEHRLAFTRGALARRADVVPFITLNFWPEDREKVVPIWDAVLETLRVAEGGRYKARN